jgi:hypothetical protein
MYELMPFAFIIRNKKLNEALERQHYLENIIWSQADQLKHTKENSPQQDKVINTMRGIFLMSVGIK